MELVYRHLEGERHRHGELIHSHPHAGPHSHAPEPSAGNHGQAGHTHGLLDPSVKRSRAGLRAVLLSLLVLGCAALAQVALFATTGSIALLADLIHNFGDAATAIPVGAAFLMRSEQAERYAGYFVVLAILISACVAGYESVRRLIHPEQVSHLNALVAAGLIGWAGNWIAARIRTNAGRALDSAALVADGNHAQADAYVSLAVVASALAVSAGLNTADPLIGLGITVVILKITWDSWLTVRGHGRAD